MSTHRTTWTFLLLSLLALLASCRGGKPPADPVARGGAWSEEVVAKMGSLPVQHGGRIKPLSMHAAATLHIVHGRRDVKLDTNGDGYGNACDADYDDNGVVGTGDFLALGSAFGSTSGQPGYDEDLDADGDGVIGAAEFLLFGSAFGAPPGPSGFSCAGSPICP